MRKLFKNVNIVNPRDSAILQNNNILTNGDFIEDISAAGNQHADDVVDLEGRYALPGLFNCHTHLTSSLEPAPKGRQAPIDWKGSDVWTTICAIGNLRIYIETGCTFVRDVGDFNFISVALREAVNMGLVTPAPDIQSAGRPICMTGGSTWRMPGMGYQADGAEECRKAARVMLRANVDWVKLMATGGTSTLGNKCAIPQLTEEELAAAVAEAHRAGKKVSCHAQGIEGAKNALRAGVDCLEHGFELDDECIDLLLKGNVWLVPTLSASYEIKKRADATTNPEFLQKAVTNVDNVFKNFPRAHAAGVRCAAGTDCGSVLNPHSNTCEELIIMVDELGMDPFEALRIGTINSAELCGVENELGSLEKGKRATFVVYDDNPVENIRTLRQCKMTVKNGGILYRADLVRQAIG